METSLELTIPKLRVRLANGESFLTELVMVETAVMKVPMEGTAETTSARGRIARWIRGWTRSRIFESREVHGLICSSSAGLRSVPFSQVKGIEPALERRD